MLQEKLQYHEKPIKNVSLHFYPKKYGKLTYREAITSEKGEYEIDDFSISDNDSIIDIGGHIGLFSLLVSQKSKCANIYSFEPIKDNFDMLKTNLELNNIKNVFPFNLAVSKNSDEINLFLSDDESAHSIISKKSESITVKSISLQKIFDVTPLQKTCAA